MGRFDRGIRPTATTSPPSFIAIEELSNRLRHAEKLVQFEDRKNRRLGKSAGTIALG